MHAAARPCAARQGTWPRPCLTAAESGFSEQCRLHHPIGLLKPLLESTTTTPKALQNATQPRLFGTTRPQCVFEMLLLCGQPARPARIVGSRVSCPSELSLLTGLSPGTCSGTFCCQMSFERRWLAKHSRGWQSSATWKGSDVKTGSPINCTVRASAQTTAFASNIEEAPPLRLSLQHLGRMH